MAFNRRWFNIFKTLFPRGNAFSLIIQKKFTQFIEGLTALPDDFRQYIDRVWLDLFPDTTRELELWNKQFGIVPGQNSIAMQRTNLASRWANDGGQGADYIQSILQAAGFNVQVHENNPPVDPDVFLNSIPQMVAGGANAYAGRDDAFAGRTGGQLLVNGPVVTNIPLYLCVSGAEFMSAGNEAALSGYFEKLETIDKIYSIPDDSDYWGWFFFIGGDATRNETTHELETIETVNIPNSRQREFKDLILTLKPAQSWVGLLIEFV
jgi:hypothetical protein